jgi:hypothetical protein
VFLPKLDRGRQNKLGFLQNSCFQELADFPPVTSIHRHQHLIENRKRKPHLEEDASRPNKGKSRHTVLIDPRCDTPPGGKKAPTIESTSNPSFPMTGQGFAVKAASSLTVYLSVKLRKLQSTLENRSLR